MVRRWFFLICLGLLLLFAKIAKADMLDYCAVPPFVGGAVEPNVLVVLDISGSMSWAAYNPNTDREGICPYNEDCGWTYTGQEEGYFEPNGIYQYQNKVWVKIGEYPETQPNLPSNVGYKTSTNDPNDKCPATRRGIGDYMGGGYTYKGSCLNFHLMRRIDIARWALTGGRPRGCDGINDPDCDPDIACVGEQCDLALYHSYYGYVRVPISRIDGFAQQMERLSVRPRVGVIFFRSDYSSTDYIYPNKVYIGDYPDGGNADPNYPYTYFKRYINAVAPYGATPTGPAMWEAYDYFKQSDEHDYGGFDIDPGTYKDPLYKCDYQGENCQLFWCAKNFIILVSDGQHNTPSCNIDYPSRSDSSDPVVPAYYMHKGPLRTVVTDKTRKEEHPIRIEKVFTVGAFLGGTGELSLKNVAMYGSFDISQGDWPGGTEGFPDDNITCYADDCCEQGQECAKGSPCTPLPDPSHPDWDANGDGVPDAFFSAQNARELKDALRRILLEITKRVSSGTSVSLLSERDRRGANVYQAVFYPSRTFDDGSTLTWIGHLYSYWFYNGRNAMNMREDTVEDKKLGLTEDLIIEMREEGGTIYVDKYESEPTGEQGDKRETTLGIESIKNLWDAGLKLHDTAAEHRWIFTYNGTEQCDFIVNNKACFVQFLGNVTNPDALIDYIRGEDKRGLRERTVTIGSQTGVWKLGDIVYSTPVLVKYDDYNVVYVGANDGMLHAFRAGYLKEWPDTGHPAALCDQKGGTCTTDHLGEELWAFIPKNVLPYLRYLADPDYCHLYFVDLMPYVTVINGRKVLIGGLRLGGACGASEEGVIQPPQDTCPDPISESCVGLSSYFALDVTDPEDPHVLWEFSHPDLGFSFSGPAVIRAADGKVYVMFLSGPTDYRGNSNQNLHAFVLTLDENLGIEDVWVKDFGSSYRNGFGGRLFTEGVDYTGDGYTDAVFFGFARSPSGKESDWEGNVVAAKVKCPNEDCSPENWEFQNIFNSAREPITSRIMIMNCFGKKYIFFGTGKYFYWNEDYNPNRNDKLYGVNVEDCFEKNCVVNAAHSTNEACEELKKGDTGQTFSWYVELEGSSEAQEEGYYKERCVTDPTVTTQNVIYFTTMEPTADPCGFGGRSRMWGVNCALGTSLSDTSCPGYTIGGVKGKLLLQTSTGVINIISPESSFTEEGGRATEWFQGVPPESPTPLLSPYGGYEGECILWEEH